MGVSAIFLIYLPQVYDLRYDPAGMNSLSLHRDRYKALADGPTAERLTAGHSHPVLSQDTAKRSMAVLSPHYRREATVLMSRRCRKAGILQRHHEDRTPDVADPRRSVKRQSGPVETTDVGGDRTTRQSGTVALNQELKTSDPSPAGDVAILPTSFCEQK